MPPLLSLLIPAFGGDFQNQNPLILAEVYSSGGSINTYMGKTGQLKTAPGWTKLGAYEDAALDSWLAILSATGEPSTNTILAWVNQNPTGIGTEVSSLLRSGDNGATWTQVAAVSGVAQHVGDFEIFGSHTYIAWGGGAPIRFSSTGVATFLTSAQLAAPTLASGGAGNLTGSFKGKVVPIRTGKERKFGSVASTAVRLVSNDLDWSWTADTDGTVVGYELWRTTGTGNEYYFVTYVEGRLTVAYAGDNISDAVLITRAALAVVGKNGDPPPQTYHCFAHGQRMIWARTQLLPRRAYISDPGDAESVDQTLSYVDCNAEETARDSIVGGIGDYQSAFILFLRRSIWKVQGTGAFIGGARDWRPKRTDATVGALSGRTVVRVPAGAKYTDENGQVQTTNQSVIAFMTPFKDIRIFDGDNDTIISHAKKDSLDLLNANAILALNSSVHPAYGFHDADRGHIIWGYPSGAAQNRVNRAVLWDYVRGTWHELSDWRLGHILRHIAGSADVLIGGNADADTELDFYDIWDEAATSRGVASNFFHTMMTKPIYLPLEEGGPPNVTYEKVIDRIALLFTNQAGSAAGNVTVGFLPHDAGDSDAVEYGTGASTIEADSRQVVKALQPTTGTNPGKYLMSQGVRVKVSSVSNTGTWALNGLELLYRVLKGSSR